MRSVVLAALLFVIALPSLPVAADEPPYATAEQVKAALDGHCVVARRWSEYYDGNTLVFRKDQITRGTWTASDQDGSAVVTFSYPRWGQVKRRIVVDGNKVSYYELDGSLKDSGTLEDN